MKIYNTLSHQVEEFKPQGNSVSLYTCGPTVYDYMHIGNLRTFVFSDILLRTLKYNNFDVNSAQNITDIDDKIIKRAKENGKTIKVISQEFTKYYLDDIKKLNIQDPTHRPLATEYIEKMVSFILVLLEKEMAYKENDGSVYFDISKFPDYGKLSGLDKRELKTGTRNLSDNYTKDNVQDFALWKAVPTGEIGGFDTKLGFGRPGWHIECSVMSQDLLGEKIDIHAGGIDLVFPHHENEIAQSESKTGVKPFVKYWIHGAHMLVDGKKMSKSLNNFYTLSDLENKGIEPLALRYLYLQTHYRQEMNFTWEALQGAQNALSKIWQHAANAFSHNIDFSSNRQPSDDIKNIINKFNDAINDDLNMPKALGIFHEGLNISHDEHDSAYLMTKTDLILGLSLEERSNKSLNNEEKEMPEDIQKMFEDREVLRKEKKYEEADKIRAEIIKLGFKVEDN